MAGETFSHDKVKEKRGQGSTRKEHTYVTQSF